MQLMTVVLFSEFACRILFLYNKINLGDFQSKTKKLLALRSRNQLFHEISRSIRILRLLTIYTNSHYEKKHGQNF